MLRIWHTWTKMCYWKGQSLYGLESAPLFPPWLPICKPVQAVQACKWRLATLPNEHKSPLLSQAVSLLNSLWAEKAPSLCLRGRKTTHVEERLKLDVSFLPLLSQLMPGSFCDC